jgi:hypothetical protein
MSSDVFTVLYRLIDLEQTKSHEAHPSLGIAIGLSFLTPLPIEILMSC